MLAPRHSRLLLNHVTEVNRHLRPGLNGAAIFYPQTLGKQIYDRKASREAFILIASSQNLGQ
jgi:hypothetical protein